MAIHTEQTREDEGGIVKNIESSAYSLIFDNLQKNQYSEPEKSTIRELGSNANDAIKEKLAALEIMSGAKSQQDYFMERQEKMFMDSNYMPEYYDAKWLCTERNETLIIYEEALPGLDKDTLRIIDYGVGVGHVVHPVTKQSRLQGILKLGYSTKRNSAIQVGKFGIGAKAALSTGADSYTMITRHNGMEFKFEVYDYKADSLVPRLNMTTRQENPHVLFHEWNEEKTEILKTDKIYWLPTEEKNGTEIIVKTRRNYRNAYRQAVKSQLLYFDNIRFLVQDEDGEIEDVPVMAEVLYRTKNIIMSRNDQFSKPHLVIGGVNYGYINWERLELNEKLGNIAYIIDAGKVDINPSRESLIWNAKTGAAILEMDDIVAKEAADVLAAEMDEPDLLKWVRKCTQVLGDSKDEDSIVGRLIGQVTDKADLKPVFKPEPGILYAEPEHFFKGIEPIYVFKGNQKAKADGGYIDVVKRENMKTWSQINKPVYIQVGKTSNKREILLLTMHPDGFIKLKVRDLLSYQEAADLSLAEITEFKKLQEDEQFRDTWLDKQKRFLSFLRASSETMEYDDIPVPESIKDPTEKEGKNTIKIDKLSPAEERALLGKTVCATYIQGYNTYNHYWDKKEPVIKDLIDDPADIVYGFQEDEPLLEIVYRSLSMDKDLPDDFFYNKDFKLVRIAKTAAKHYKNHTYVKDFLLSINPKTKTIAMHSKLVEWHTGRKISEVVSRMKFLENFGIFNAEIFRTYQDIKAFWRQNYNPESIKDLEMIPELNSYADKVISLQLYIEEHPGNSEAIAAQCKALFEMGPEDETFVGSVGINMPVYKNLQKLLDYIQPLEHIFNYIGPLVESGKGISPELEYEIREIMKNKKVV